MSYSVASCCSGSASSSAASPRAVTPADASSASRSPPSRRDAGRSARRRGATSSGTVCIILGGSWLRRADLRALDGERDLAALGVIGRVVLQESDRPGDLGIELGSPEGLLDAANELARGGA